MSCNLKYKQVVKLREVTYNKLNTDWRVDIRCPTLTTITIVFYKASLEYEAINYHAPCTYITLQHNTTTTNWNLTHDSVFTYKELAQLDDRETLYNNTKIRPASSSGWLFTAPWVCCGLHTEGLASSEVKGLAMQRNVGLLSSPRGCVTSPGSVTSLLRTSYFRFSQN